jgi:hypothetical protein
MKNKEAVEIWVSPSGRQIPTREATKKDELAMPITPDDLRDANENDIYGCAIAIKGGVMTGLQTKEEREEWGQGIWWHVGILALPDPDSPVGRTRVRGRIPEDLAKLVDKVKKLAKPQMVHFKTMPPSLHRTSIREGNARHQDKVKNGAVVNKGQKYTPSRPRLKQGKQKQHANE